MRIGADPDELLRAAAAGTGQAFTLDHVARVLDHAGWAHRTRSQHSPLDASAVVAGLRGLVQRIVLLDEWLTHVAALLRAADGAPLLSSTPGMPPGFALHLLAHGAGHPATRAVRGIRVDPALLPVGRLTDDELDELARWPGLLGPWRDRLHRQRLQRWLRNLDRRIAAVPPDPGGRLVRWLDRHLLERTSSVVDLRIDHDERVAWLRAEAAGARKLLADERLTLWSFDPTSDTPRGGPALRVALGDPGTADKLAVLLPGTSVGLAAPEMALDDLTALHDETTGLADSDVAVVLDLYDTPGDLGRAADPGTGAAAGNATAAFLADLPPGQRRTTVIGHSYGAFTAGNVATATGQELDALILLGAPGAGVQHRDELRVDEVWAARADKDPIRFAADFDEHVAALPPWARDLLGPLTRPDALLGPDPLDPEFGARRLPTDADPDVDPVTAHVTYLSPGSASLGAAARVVLGRPMAAAGRPAAAVRRAQPGRPPKQDRRASAATE